MMYLTLMAKKSPLVEVIDGADGWEVVHEMSIVLHACEQCLPFFTATAG